MAEDIKEVLGDGTSGQTATGQIGESSAAAAPVPSQQSTSAPAPAQASETSQVAGVSGAAAGATPGAASSTPSQAATQEAWRQAGKQYGIDLSGFSDPGAALGHYLRERRETQQYVPYGQHYVQNYEQYQKFNEWQKQQAAQAEKKPDPWWNPPEWDPRWMAQLERDPATGQFKTREGAPPDTLQKYQKFKQYQQDFADKFLANPVEALGPMIDERAQAIADKKIQEQFSTYQQGVYAKGFVERNANWLHQRDQAGNVLRDQYGQPQMSAEGERFRQHVYNAEQLGLKDVQQIENYATKMLKLDLLEADYQKRQAGQANQQIKQDFLQANNRLANHSGSIQQPAANGKAPVQNERLSLGDQLRQAFAAEGVKDADFVR